MRFQDAAPDARAIVYAGIQADPLVARAVMNGESTDPSAWRTMFPGLFGPDLAANDPAAVERAGAVLVASLAVADRGEGARSQYRGAIVESLTETLVRRRHPGVSANAVRRERRILFDGVRAEIHPYDVTVELPGESAAIDCKWGARGISADVLHQLDDARTHAADDDERLATILVVFDAALSCTVRLERQTAPHEATEIVSLETLDRLATAP